MNCMPLLTLCGLNGSKTSAGTMNASSPIKKRRHGVQTASAYMSHGQAIKTVARFAGNSVLLTSPHTPAPVPRRDGAAARRSLR